MNHGGTPRPGPTVAAAQTVPVPGTVEANLEAHARLVRAAADHGARWVVFPELSLTGYEPELARELAFDPDDARLDPLIRLSAEHDTTILAGAPVRLPTGLHVGAFIVSPQGSVDVYTKRHLGEGEDAFFNAGTLDPSIRIGDKPAAIAVCADANHPSHARRAAERGAKIYLVSTFITPSELDRKAELLRDYATRHRMVVVFANYGGPSGGMEAGGRSAVWDSSGTLLARLDGAGEGLDLVDPVTLEATIRR